MFCCLLCKQNLKVLLISCKVESKATDFETIIIGGGQAGLATGYFLKKLNKDFVILDDNRRTGDSWRKRWKSLKLFTPAQHDSLPGMKFPGEYGSYPEKDEVADYLEQYRNEFGLPEKLNIKVNRLAHRNSHFEIEADSQRLISTNVVIATGTNPFPRIPAISSDINPEIFQIHSSGYTDPEMLPPGDVLVVGAGTSGVEIALELSKTHKTYISGNPTFHIPDNLLKYAGNFYWWFISNIVTLSTPLGKRAKKSIIHGGAPLIRVSSKDLSIAGINCLPRVAGTDNGHPKLEDNSVIRVSSVVWATGYKPDFSWIDMKVTDETGWPVSVRGVSPLFRGLFFVGMPFQYGLTSGLIGGVGRDASVITQRIGSNNRR